MKKALVVCGFVLVASAVMAQTTVKKVPFMPYLQTSGGIVGQSVVSPGLTGAADAGQKTRQLSTYKIKFAKGSSRLSDSAKAIIKQIAKTSGNKQINFIAYYSRKVPTSLSDRRIEVIMSSLSDLGVSAKQFIKNPIEFRDDQSAMVPLNEVVVTF